MTAVSTPLWTEPLRLPVAPERPPIVLSRRKRVLFSVILTVVVLVVLELIAGFYLRVTRGYDGTHLYEFEFDPYKNILPARNFVDTRGVRHNSVGFRRSSEVSKTKPANTYRIFLMGGSTAYGTGGLWPHLQRDYAVIKNSETIDAYLERDHKPMPEMERRLFEFNVSSYLPNYEQFIHRAADVVRARETAMASELDAQFIDLTGIYGGVREQIYTDYVHLTPRGNEMLARAVADRLLPVIRRDMQSACNAGASAAATC